MATIPPESSSLGGRMLAAIVFTDAVSFTARMRVQELSTLQLLERDFAVMRQEAERHSGTVLKSTGDGLLLHFNSAVSAVEFALKIQRSFALRAQESDDDVLKHRVGVHLGDIFVSESDVMGDGVNMAARVQSAADPGGVCISQAVYEVVRHKLELDVDRIDNRGGKNAAEVGQLYRVLLEPRRVAPVRPLAAPPVREEKTVFSGAEKWVLSGLVLAAIAAGAVYLVFENSRLQTAQKDNQRIQKALEEAVAAPTAPAVAQAAAAPPDFVALTLAAAPPPGAPSAVTLRNDATVVAARFATWRDQQLATYSTGSLLEVKRDAVDMRVFTRGGRVWAATSRGNTEFRFQDQNPREQDAVILALLQKASPPPSVEILAGAAAFAYLNGRRELAAELQRLAR